MTDPMTGAALFELLSLEFRVNSDGTMYYCNTQGQLHRVHGPAIVYSDGGREWYQNDRLHREHGPAVEYSDGRCAWWQDGLPHRLDGPAVEQPDGPCAWFINGIELTETEWQRAVASMGVV